MRLWSFIVLGVMVLLLLGAAHTLPPLRRQDNPISRHVEPYYLSRAIEDTATPNVVSAVLADYRSYDTFGETTVVFAAGLSCYLLLRRLL